jgi:hypothetical protein
MKRNVTITLDEETARWARVEAARRDTSVARLVGEMLRARMLDEREYETAMRSYSSRPAKPLKRSGGYPSREVRHERARLR